MRLAPKDEEGLPGKGNSLVARHPEARGGVCSCSWQVGQCTIAHHKLMWFHFNRNIFCFHFDLHLVIKINVFSWEGENNASLKYVSCSF